MIIKRTNSRDLNFTKLITDLDQDLYDRYGSAQEWFNTFNVIIDLDTVVLAFDQDFAVGCACYKSVDDDTVELKRMFVAASHRGKGFGSAILSELERWALENGFGAMILETGTLQTEAIALYQKQGFYITPNYEPYVGNELSVCMKKVLIAPSESQSLTHQQKK